jgi:hypothetical protein
MSVPPKVLPFQILGKQLEFATPLPREFGDGKLPTCGRASVGTAYSSIKLARYAPENELSMDLLVAQSVLEFGSSLRDALDDAGEWARARGVGPVG